MATPHPGVAALSFPGDPGGTSFLGGTNKGAMPDVVEMVSGIHPHDVWVYVHEWAC